MYPVARSSNKSVTAPTAEFLRTHIFGPVGMRDSLVIPIPPARVPNFASAYALHKGAWVDISNSPLNFIVGHDGVISTIDDMTRWAAVIQGGKIPPAKYRRTAFTSGTTKKGERTNYGFAWRLSSLDAQRVLQHEGCWSGIATASRTCPQGLTAIVLSNATEGKEFWNCEDALAIARSLAQQKHN